MRDSDDAAEIELHASSANKKQKKQSEAVTSALHQLTQPTSWAALTTASEEGRRKTTEYSHIRIDFDSNIEFKFCWLTHEATIGNS